MKVLFIFAALFAVSVHAFSELISPHDKECIAIREKKYNEFFPRIVDISHRHDYVHSDSRHDEAYVHVMKLETIKRFHHAIYRSFNKEKLSTSIISARNSYNILLLDLTCLSAHAVAEQLGLIKQELLLRRLIELPFTFHVEVETSFPVLERINEKSILPDNRKLNDFYLKEIGLFFEHARFPQRFRLSCSEIDDVVGKLSCILE